jgi:predicted permease
MKWWRPFRTDEDLADELQAHREMQTRDDVAAGLSEAEANRRARLQLGGTRATIERIRDQEFATVIESWYRDFVLGFRSLRKNPLFSIIAILTVALGIGANIAIFTLLYGLVLRSLPVERPGELAHITIFSPASQFTDTESIIPYKMFQQFRRRQQSFVDVSALHTYDVSMQDSDGIERVFFAGMVSGNVFSVLGVRPFLGRLIEPVDDARGGPQHGWPVVLSYGFWTGRFGGDVHVIGRQIRIANIPVTIVGVTPPGFHGVWPGADVKVYLPMQFDNVLKRKDVLNAANSLWFCSAIGRLKPGVTMQQAQAEASLYWAQSFHQFIPAQNWSSPFFRQATLQVASAKSGLPTYFSHVYSHPLRLMQGLVLAVLVLCCINVGGLMMSKVYVKQREFAIRTAIGAARWRLVRQYLTESFLIALAGAALGAVAAWYANRSLLYFFRDPMMSQPIAVDAGATVFWVAGLCAILATMLFGTLPAWRIGASDPGSLLKSHTASASRKSIAGRAFVPVQVALSLVLVALASMLSLSLHHIRSERTGFELNHVTIQSTHFEQLPQKGDAKLDVYQRMVDRLQQMPGMRSAAVTWMTPMTGIEETSAFEATPSGQPPREDSHMPYNIVGPGYFRTIETRILEGREFLKNERKPNVCILNQAAASYFFPHSEPLGAAVRSRNVRDFPNPIVCRVVGVAEDAKFANLLEPAPRTIYFPLSTEVLRGEPALVFLMNSETKAQAIAGYRQMLSEIAPAMPLVIFVTLKEQEDAALGSERLITGMCSAFAGLALFLSALGLYGLLSSSVAQRTSEIGVRIALGAQRHTVLRMILSDALRLLAVGVLLGALALFFAVHFVEQMLYRVSAFDPISLAAVLAVLIAVTLAAAFFPALRASSVDPIEALRAE